MEHTKYFALLEELETSNKLIKLGFGELQNINLNNDFYFLPFQLLSQGFERFMKSYICLGYYDEHHKLPSPQYLKKLGHDLEKLLHEILLKYYCQFDRQQFHLDIIFLKSHRDLKRLLYLLSEFGKLSRYYNFDLITGNEKIGIDTKKHWEKFENGLLRDEDFKKLTRPDSKHEVFNKVSNHIIIIFEKFISALSRQILFNAIGEEAINLTTSTYSKFAMMYDENFGKTDYRSFTSSYNSRPRKVHKRTFNDFFLRKFNPNYAFKKITKLDYKDEWPFYAEEITLECRYKHWCIVSIDGFDYALNGSAKGKYKLEDPHEAGMAILGKSTSNFLRLALELGKEKK